VVAVSQRSAFARSTGAAVAAIAIVLALPAASVGKELPAAAGPDSFSFLPALEGRTSRRAPIVMQSGGGFMTIRSGRWKLIEGLGSGGFSQPSRITPGPGDLAGQLCDRAGEVTGDRARLSRFSREARAP
jgi:hypothetical protein